MSALPAPAVVGQAKMVGNGSDANITSLFCGATLDGSVVTWNVTVQDILWSPEGFFASCASFVLLPAALFIFAVILRILGCLTRLGDDMGFGGGAATAAAATPAAASPAIIAVEYCTTDNFRYWGAVMVLVAWPVLIAHGQLNAVGDRALLVDEAIGAVLVLLAVALMLGDQVLDVKLRWRAHKRKHPKAEAGCVSPTSLRHVLFWILVLLAVGTPLLGYYEQHQPFSPDFQFWSLAIRTALALFALGCNAAAGRYLTTGTDILRAPTTTTTTTRRRLGQGATAAVRATTTTTGSSSGELRDPLLVTAGGVDEEEEEEEEVVRRSPEEDASWVSQGWFSWLNPIMRVGARRPLVHEDLYPVHPTDNCEACQVRERASLTH